MYRIKLFYLCLCFLSIFDKLLSQDTTIFAPLGATWYYKPYSYPNEFLLFTFVSEKDTIINGFNAREIACYVFENGEYVRREDLFKYIAAVGNQVYHKVGDNFVLLYDFGAQPGDTIQSAVEDFGIFMGCESDFSEELVIEFSYVIDSVDFIEIDGEILRRQFIYVIDEPGLDPTWSIWGPVQERIGYFEEGGFWWGQGEACLLEGTGYLRCYVDMDISYRNPFHGTYDCDYTSLQDASHSQLSLDIHPNPAGDYFVLKNDVDNIKIINYLGHSMPVAKNGSSIDVFNYSPGIYYIICEKDGIYRFGSFTKI